MLILARTPGEQVIIGDDVLVTVIDVRGERVRLGFTGPDGMPIDRMEVRISKALEKALKDRQEEANGSATDTQ